MTPIKPRPFLVVLATVVASQDGVVAARDAVRNCRTRPGAEQRLLPVIGHPVPGKCEPRFTLPPNSLPALVKHGTLVAPSLERLWLAGNARSQLRDGRFPSSPLGLLGRPGAPLVPSQPQPGSSPASFLRIRTTPPAPFVLSGVPTRRVPSARGEKQTSRLAVQPHLSMEMREKQTQPSVPRRSRQGRGKRDDLFSRVGLNHGGFKTSLGGLYLYDDHIKTPYSCRNLWLRAFPLPFLDPLLSH